MAAPHLSTAGDPVLDPTATAVIDRYLAAVASGLAHPSPAVIAELRGDLVDATAAGIARALEPAAAAEAAVAEFGDVRVITDSLRPELAARHAHRIGSVLLVSGPLVGCCWLVAALLSGLQANGVGLLTLVLVGPVVAVGAPATAITVASSGRLCRWLAPHSRVAWLALGVASVAASLGDVLLLAGAALLLVLPGAAPSPVLALAAVASVARLGFVVRSTGWFGGGSARLPRGVAKQLE